MQKLFIVLTALITYYTGFTQQMGYHPVFIDQCTRERLFDFITVFNADRTYFADNSQSDTIPIPKPGIYFTTVFPSVYQPNKIEIHQNEVLHDTLYTEKLRLAQYISNPPFSEYFDCEKKAEGTVTDYYFNRKIRQEGTFKNGQLIGALKKYYPTGEIQEIFYSSKKKWQITKYHQNGKVMSSKGNLHGYQEYEYYENGQLKSEQNNKGWALYSQNGIIYQKTTKRLVKRPNIFNREWTNTYRYIITNYDSTGKKLEEFTLIAHENEETEYLLPGPVTKTNANDFRNIIFYKKGLEDRKINFLFSKGEKNYPYKFEVLKINGGKWEIEKQAPVENLLQIVTEYRTEYVILNQ